MSYGATTNAASLKATSMETWFEAIGTAWRSNH